MRDAAFTHDVFLSHSAKDKAVVRPLAERLLKDGLEHGRLDILRSSFCPLPFLEGSLAQFLYINWRPAVREQEYAMFRATDQPKRREAATLNCRTEPATDFAF